LRFYIISDNMHGSIAVANEINNSGNTAIISDVDGSDLRAAVSDLKENVDVDNYFCIVISKSPKEFTITANKLQDARAVLCKDRDDAMEAYDAKANVLILDSKEGADALVDVIDGALSRTGKSVPAHAREKTAYSAPQQIVEDVQAPQPKRENPLKGMMSKFKGSANTGQDNQQQRRQQAQGSSSTPSRKPKSNKGVFDSLKDALGLDEEEEE